MSLPDKLPSYYSPRISSELPDCSSPLTFDTYSRCSMRCQYCVPEGSGITMSDGSIKAIEQVEIGDVLLGYDEENKRLSPTLVDQTMHRETIRYITFKISNEYKFRVTPEHPVFTKRGWVEAKEITKDDCVLTHTGFFKEKPNSKTIELIFKWEPTVDVSRHKLYSIWKQMVHRCHLPTAHNFLYYGGRGIQVCTDWRYHPERFFKWAEPIYREGLELDRIGNNEGYQPDNCRFISHQENSNNRGLRSDNSTGFIGVRQTGKGTYRYGTRTYSSAKKAAVAREVIVISTGGAFNFPDMGAAVLQWNPIQYIRYQNKPVVVYNFECWPHNNYFHQTRKSDTSKFNLNAGVLSHNCFSHSQKDINPGTKSAPLQGVYAEKLFNAIDGKSHTKEGRLFYEHFYKDKFLFHWGGLADSFCHFERKYDMSYPILEGLLERGYPVMFSSKGPAITDDKYVQLFEKYAKQNSVAFQFSIVTSDDKLARKVEPGVPSPTERFEYMRYLSDLGYHTILRLRPFIIGITDHTLPDILQKAYDSGASAISTEFYALDHRCVGSMRKATSKMGKLMGIDDIFGYFSKLSPKERGGYCRLNRVVKETYIKFMYKFCVDHNMIFACSDPDYKELSMTGNCCGLPDMGGHPNPVMNNWSPHQLTAAVKEARRTYHKTGKAVNLEFNDVYGRHDWIFDEIDLSHQDIGCTSYPYAQRKQLTLRHLLQSKWNNLHSYANPRNYLHGKVLPTGLDENGKNLIYKYNAQDWEKRWADEGIDLTL